MNSPLAGPPETESKMTSAPDATSPSSPPPPSDGVSEEFDWFPWLTEGLLLFVVGAVGLVGNCCSIAIFARLGRA